MRVGPDGKLYIGVGTGLEPRDAQNISAAAGKILRVRDDGATPDDNPWSSPTFSIGHRDPRGLAWHPMSGALLEVEGDDEGGGEVNAIRAGANYGWPLARRGEQPAASTPAALLPPGTEPSGATTIRLATSPLYGDLIVSVLGGEDLLRVRFSTTERGVVSGRLLQGRFGRIAQVTSAPDGSLYFVTGNHETSGEGNDMLVRLVSGSR
jgi:glucose/arabinose dehydrogenase